MAIPPQFRPWASMAAAPRASPVQEWRRSPSAAGERQDALQRRQRRRARENDALAEQEGVADDLALLLEAIALEPPARLDRIGIKAEGVAHQRQIIFAALL